MNELLISLLESLGLEASFTISYTEIHRGKGDTQRFLDEFVIGKFVIRRALVLGSSLEFRPFTVFFQLCSEDVHHVLQGA